MKSKNTMAFILIAFLMVSIVGVSALGLGSTTESATNLISETKADAKSDDSNTNLETNTESETETSSETEVSIDENSESETSVESDAEAKSELELISDTESSTNTESETSVESESNTNTETSNGNSVNGNAETSAEAKTDSKKTVKKATKFAGKTQGNVENKIETSLEERIVALIPNQTEIDLEIDSTSEGNHFILWTNDGANIMWGTHLNGKFRAEDNNGKKAFGIYYKGTLAGFYEGKLFFGKAQGHKWRAKGLFGLESATGGFISFKNNPAETDLTAEAEGKAKGKALSNL